MDIDFLISEGLGFLPGSVNQKYKTVLDEKIEPISNIALPESIAKCFKDSFYITNITLSDIVLYRTYGCGYSGKGAYSNGAFATTEFAESRIDVKIRLALKPEWKNTLLVEEKIVVPSGTIIQVGIVAPVVLPTGTVLSGGAEQILLPKNWSSDWIAGYREITSKPLFEYPQYYPDPPKAYREKPNR